MRTRSRRLSVVAPIVLVLACSAALAQRSPAGPRDAPIIEGDPLRLPGAPVGPDGKPLLQNDGRAMTGRELIVFTIDMRWLGGASAYKVEHDVTVPIQRAIAGMPGLMDVKSTAVGGHVQTRATFDKKTDPTTTAVALRTRLDQIRYKLPHDASPPAIAWRREITGHF